MFLKKRETHCILNMLMAIVKVIVNAVLISYNTEIIARIFTVINDGCVLVVLKT